MSRYSKDHVPSYRHYKRTNQAVVLIAGKFTYLGEYGSEESRQKYNRLIAEWFAAGRDPTVLKAKQDIAAADELNVEQVIAAFLHFAQSYYRDRDGNPTTELKSFKDTLRTLRRLYGTSPATAFGPKCLKVCQADMVEQGLARNTINRRINRIRQVFKWAVAEELVPASVLEGLRAVSGLKAGRTEAKETPAVKAVAEANVRAAMAKASRVVAAMIELQLITGMRSGEMTIMRTGDIDRTGEVWVYVPSKHKTQHHGHERIIYLGKRAQAIVTPFLKLNPNAYLFSPADATEERFADAASRRVTPHNAGNRRGTNRKTKPKRMPGDRYRDTSFAKAVARACDRAFPAPEGLSADAVKAWQKQHRFHPHQLRHTAATRFRREHNLETARALLGQKSMKAAEVYAEMDTSKAKAVMAASG